MQRQKKKNAWLVLILSIFLSNCATTEKKNPVSDLTICSLVWDEDKEFHFECTPPTMIDYQLKLDDDKVKDLVCLPSVDYTRLVIQTK